MKRGGPLPRRTPLAAMSPRKRRKAKARRQIVAAALERDGGCVAWAALTDCPYPPHFPATCGGPLDPHEIIPRSAWRDGDLALNNVVMVCRRHHEWIDNYPNEAQSVRLHAKSWDRPAA